jgi:hypothetical protein
MALLILTLGCSSPAQPTAPPVTGSSEPSPSAPTTTFLPAPASPPVAPTDPLVGRYTLEIDAGARSGERCDLVPDAATRRTFTADVHRLESGHAVVRLYDAKFLADSPSVGYGCLGLGTPTAGFEPCHQFSLAGDPEALVANMTAPDDWRDNEIWEAMPNGYLLQIHGQATGRAVDGRLEMVGTGGLWYGNGLPASTFSGCRSDALRLTFTRR